MPNRTGLATSAAMARILVSMEPCDEPIQRKRKLVAEFCRLLGEQIGRPGIRPGQGLSPRMQQTLECLLAGDSEKQIAAKFGISQHTIHIYVKGLYRRYTVSSRAELLSRFVRQPVLAPTRPFFVEEIPPGTSG